MYKSVWDMVKPLALKQDENKVEFHIPKDVTQGYVNNQKEDYTFKFNHLLGMEAKQEEVFDTIAKDVEVS